MGSKFSSLGAAGVALHNLVGSCRRQPHDNRRLFRRSDHAFWRLSDMPAESGLALAPISGVI